MSILKYICDLGFDWLTAIPNSNTYILIYVGPYSNHTITHASLATMSRDERDTLVGTMRADFSKIKSKYTVKISRCFAQKWVGYLEASESQGEAPTIVFTTSTLEALQSARAKAEANHIILNLFATFFHELPYLVSHFVGIGLLKLDFF